MQTCPDNIFDKLNFAEKLCHECNNIAPTYRYCHKMYGGIFKQTFGWYINKQCYEFGIVFLTPPKCKTLGKRGVRGPYFLDVIQSECPDSILSIIESNENQNVDRKNDIVRYTIEKNQKIKIHHIVENEVRKKFGHKNVGESWINETMLYYHVKAMFPTYCISQHYRPEFLKGMEIDVFIKELNLGIEYQGIQHFQPMKHLGGKESYEKLKIRDEMKRKLCSVMGVKLIYVNFDEDISEDLIKAKISDIL